jgi:tRNA modification GTPase
VLYFPGPNSFTGEDVAELQAHGGPIILDLLLREACLRGARQAGPGEFSQRAYLNDKMDLAQAEAIADLINSTTEQAALSATRSLQGEFSRKIDELVALVTSLRIYVEAAIDFPEEEIDFIEEGQVAAQLEGIINQLESVLEQARQGTLLQEGMKLVIAGRPNAGKSSLLNALAGADTAIVTAIPGTTRDVLREHIQLDGMPLHVVDTAGLRDSDDEVEQEGIRRARLEIASADRILLVTDSTEPDAADILVGDTVNQGGGSLADLTERTIPITVVRNKTDLSGLAPSIEQRAGRTFINLSAKTGAGMDLLREHLKQSIGFSDSAGSNFSARRRHLQALEQARHFLKTGQEQLAATAAGELLAEDLRQCQQSLGEITGAISSDELLGKIFSSFCIGK